MLNDKCKDETNKLNMHNWRESTNVIKSIDLIEAISNKRSLKTMNFTSTFEFYFKNLFAHNQSII